LCQPLPQRNPGTPPSLATNRPPPNLGKWGRPEGLPPRFSDSGSSPSRSSTSTFRERRPRGPADDVPEGRRYHRPEPSRTEFSSHTKWKRPVPFPMSPSRSERERPPRSFPRDPALPLSSSTPHPFPSPSTAARSRQATREPARLPESNLSADQFVEEATFGSEDSYSNYARERLNESKARRSRVEHKERGSLRRTFRDDELPSRNRDGDPHTKAHSQHPKPKSKSKALNGIKAEVVIPSVVSVGNLARILGVSLGELHLDEKAPSIHCLGEKLDFSGRCEKLGWQRKLPMITVFWFSRPLSSRL